MNPHLKILYSSAVVLLMTASAFPLALGTQTQAPISHTLYVGGSGPGNYTTIQDAIDAAVDGDTVFVYHDSSPYVTRTIDVDRSITLVGEDRESTQIWPNPYYMEAGMVIEAPHVHVHNLTLLTGSTGIIIRSSDVELSYMDVQAGVDGICVGTLDAVMQRLWIHDNWVHTGLAGGIGLYFCNNSLISNNTVVGDYGKYWRGLSVEFSFNNRIVDNYFVGCELGCLCSFSGNNVYNRNVFSSDDSFLSVENSFHETFIGNAFNGGGSPAEFHDVLQEKLDMLKEQRNNSFFAATYHLSGRHHWDGNYWGENIQRPYIIQGYSIIGPVHIKRVNFDWHPETEPWTQ